MHHVLGPVQLGERPNHPGKLPFGDLFMNYRVTDDPSKPGQMIAIDVMVKSEYESQIGASLADGVRHLDKKDDFLVVSADMGAIDALIATRPEKDDYTWIPRTLLPEILLYRQSANGGTHEQGITSQHFRAVLAGLL